MTWTPVTPDGTKSVKANRSTLAGNFAYIEDKMGDIVNDLTNDDTVKDHYWNVDANLDGRHRYINSPPYTIGTSPADPVVGASMGSVSYSKTKSAADSPDNQDVQQFFRNAGGIMQMMGMRACIVFDLTPASPVTNAPTATVIYAHNATVDMTNFTWFGRKFTVNFTTTLPSENYLVLGGCMSDETNEVRIGVDGVAAGSQSTVKSTTFVIMSAFGLTSSSNLPRQIWLACVGG